MRPGYFFDNAFPVNYQHEDFWPDYGKFFGLIVEPCYMIITYGRDALNIISQADSSILTIGRDILSLIVTQGHTAMSGARDIMRIVLTMGKDIISSIRDYLNIR